MLAVVIAEGVALGFLGLLVVGLLRSHADILRSLHELGAGQAGDERGPRLAGGRTASAGVGEASHDLAGETLEGEAVAVSLRGAEHDTLLAFLSASCYTCQPFWDALSGAIDVPNRARIIAVVQSGDSVSKLRALAGPDLLVVISDAAWSDYEVPGSPHFVYVDGPAGHVAGEGTASTWPQVRDLLEQALEGSRRVARTSASPIEIGPDPRDNAERIDRELLSAGIGPGHASLYADVASSGPTNPGRPES